jgi:hypothetical protein
MLTLLGTPLLIRWEKFKPGTSFFVPCIDRRLTLRFVTSEAQRMGFNVICKQVVEKGKYGLRVWRVDATIEPHSSPP